MGMGAPTVVEDWENGGLENTKVQIVGVSAGSPAQLAQLEIGDTILELKAQEAVLIDKVSQVQEFILPEVEKFYV